MNSDLRKKLDITDEDVKMAQDVITAFGLLNNATMHFRMRKEESQYTMDDMESVSVPEYNRMVLNRNWLVNMADSLLSMNYLRNNPVERAKSIEFYLQIRKKQL